MKEHTGAGDRWIPEREYEFICDRVPILCVDLLPIVAGGERFGLIERDDWAGRRGLNLIGGAVLLDESLTDAVNRHLLATLGHRVRLETGTLSSVGVYQYFKTAKPGQLHDPRKNAVSVTYTAVITGVPEPLGEARKFVLFDTGAPPPRQAFGFDQGTVVYDALRTLSLHAPRLCDVARRA